MVTTQVRLAREMDRCLALDEGQGDVRDGGCRAPPSAGPPRCSILAPIPGGGVAGAGRWSRRSSRLLGHEVSGSVRRRRRVGVSTPGAGSRRALRGAARRGGLRRTDDLVDHLGDHAVGVSPSTNGGGGKMTAGARRSRSRSAVSRPRARARSKTAGRASTSGRARPAERQGELQVRAHRGDQPASSADLASAMPPVRRSSHEVTARLPVSGRSRGTPRSSGRRRPATACRSSAGTASPCTPAPAAMASIVSRSKPTRPARARRPASPIALALHPDADHSVSVRLVWAGAVWLERIVRAWSRTALWNGTVSSHRTKTWVGPIPWARPPFRSGRSPVHHADGPARPPAPQPRRTRRGVTP